MVVAGLYVFVGNSGPVVVRPYQLHVPWRLYDRLADYPAGHEVDHAQRTARHGSLHTQLPMWVATPISGVFAALFALIVGRVIMRLSGIAASIATFGLDSQVTRLFELGLGDGRPRALSSERQPP